MSDLNNNQQELISKKSNYLLTRFLLFIVVVVPFVLYATEKISKDWLNRSGIIVNFLAGFMVAPDLIGINRLVYVEEIFEKCINSNLSKITSWNILENIGDKNPIYELILLMLFTFLWSSPSLLFYYFPWNKIAYVWIIFLIFNASFYLFTFKVSTVNHLFLIITDAILLTCMFLFYFVIIPNFFLVIYSITFIIYITMILPLKYFLNQLEGDGKLIRLLVKWGIVFFIMGNLMQLVATF